MIRFNVVLTVAKFACKMIFWHHSKCCALQRLNLLDACEEICKSSYTIRSCTHMDLGMHALRRVQWGTTPICTDSIPMEKFINANYKHFYESSFLFKSSLVSFKRGKLKETYVYSFHICYMVDRGSYEFTLSIFLELSFAQSWERRYCCD